MHWSLTPYALPLVAAAVVTGILAGSIWRRRSAPGATAFALLLAVLTEWTLAYALVILGGDLETKVFWTKVRYVGVVFTPLGLWVFAHQYVERADGRTLPRGSRWLALIPVLTLAVAFTNERHGLMWRETYLETAGPFLGLETPYGPYFWLHAAYSYVLLFTGAWLVARDLLRQRHVYRRQTAALLLALAAPWLSNALTLAGRSPIPGLDLTPVAFAVTAVALAWSTGRFRFLDLLPVARDAVFEEMRDGVVVLDSVDRIVDLNPAAEQILGAPAGKLVGTSVEGTGPEWAQVLAGDGETATRGLPRTLTTADGRAYAIHSSEMRRGRVTGRLVVLRDVTRERELDRLKDEWVSNVSHELRTPLTSIRGFSELLLSYGDQDLGTRDEFLRIINGESERLTRLIDDLLDLSKIEAGRLELHLEEIDLQALLLDCARTFLPVKEEGIAFVSDVPANLPPLRADPDRIQQVVYNLLGNAAKFTSQGTITLRAAHVGDSVQITVADTGIGVAREDLERIFDKFEQARHLAAGKPGGTGLGLSISRRIVEAHGGSVEVSSDGPDRGSCFTVRLPCAGADLLQPASLHRQDAAPVAQRPAA